MQTNMAPFNCEDLKTVCKFQMSLRNEKSVHYFSHRTLTRVSKRYFIYTESREDNKYAGVYYEYKVARTSFFDEMHEICLKMPFVVWTFPSITFLKQELAKLFSQIQRCKNQSLVFDAKEIWVWPTLHPQCHSLRSTIKQSHEPKARSTTRPPWNYLGRSPWDRRWLGRKGFTSSRLRY